MQISAIQMDIAFGDVSGNLERSIQWIQRAKEEGSQLAVLPECTLTGYCYESRKEAEAAAMSVDASPLRRLIDVAGSEQMHVVIGFLEITRDNCLYNTTALLGHDGLVGLYRKIHLPHLGVDRFVDTGDRPYTAFSAGDAKIGLAICYDISFPEPMRVLGLAGADIIALSTSWPVAARRTAEIVPPARSMENHLFFVAANRIGQERGFIFCGLSSICGPDGIELARASDDSECILHAEVDLAQARSKRIERTAGVHVIDRFADRRPEFYGPIVG